MPVPTRRVSKGRVMMSLNALPDMREIFAGFLIETIDIRSPETSYLAARLLLEVRTHQLINRPSDTQLRFAGKLHVRDHMRRRRGAQFS